MLADLLKIRWKSLTGEYSKHSHMPEENPASVQDEVPAVHPRA